MRAAELEDWTAALEGEKVGVGITISDVGLIVANTVPPELKVRREERMEL